MAYMDIPTPRFEFVLFANADCIAANHPLQDSLQR